MAVAAGVSIAAAEGCRGALPRVVDDASHPTLHPFVPQNKDNIASLNAIELLHHSAFPNRDGDFLNGYRRRVN